MFLAWTCLKLLQKLGLWPLLGLTTACTYPQTFRQEKKTIAQWCVVLPDYLNGSMRRGRGLTCHKLRVGGPALPTGSVCRWFERTCRIYWNETSRFSKVTRREHKARLALECCKRLLWRQSTVCLCLSHFCWPCPAPTSSGFAKWLQDVGDLGPVVQRPDNFIRWIRHHSRSKICFMLWTFSTVVRVSIFAVTRGNIEIFVQIETVRWWLIYGIKLSGLWITGPRLSAGVGYTFKWFPDVGELTETLPIWM